jgi:hypothetical protein
MKLEGWRSSAEPLRSSRTGSFVAATGKDRADSAEDRFCRDAHRGNEFERGTIAPTSDPSALPDLGRFHYQIDGQ